MIEVPKKFINKKTLIYLSFLLFYLCLPEIAWASNDVPALTTALQGILDIIQGTTGKLLATLAVIGVGFFWMAGKISLKHAGMIGLGIGVIFGAATIVGDLGVS